MYQYILIDGQPVPCPDLLEWGRWMQEHRSDYIVKKTWVGETEISTVFLGLDHNWWNGPPLLFETRIFGGQHDGDQWRYSTREQASLHHEEVVKQIQKEDTNNE